jgi:hypothetical protein
LLAVAADVAVEAADVAVEVARGPEEVSPPRRATHVRLLRGRALGRVPAAVNALLRGLLVQQPARKLQRARLAVRRVKVSLLDSAQRPPEERRIALPDNVQRLVS